MLTGKIKSIYISLANNEEKILTKFIIIIHSITDKHRKKVLK